MNKVTLKIEGMQCPMCEAHINDIIRRTVPDAKKISSSHRTGESSFLTASAPDVAFLKKSIKDTGYKMLSCDIIPYEKKGIFRFGI